MKNNYDIVRNLQVGEVTPHNTQTVHSEFFEIQKSARSCLIPYDWEMLPNLVHVID